MLDSLHHLWHNIALMDRDTPLSWPLWQRFLAKAMVCVAVVGLMWVLWLPAEYQALKGAEAAHERLRTEFSAKLLRAAPLAQLQNQQAQSQRRLALLDKQLPGPLEMDLLLAEMSRAGRDRQLRFEWLRPAELTPQLLYAQQRIALRVVGRYQDLAGFATDLSGLAWLLSIQSFSLLPAQNGELVMEAVVRTLRPLTATPGEPTDKGTS